MMKETMADMTWPELKGCADRGAIVLIPLGVIEEHGPQLCLGTDAYTAVIHCREVRKALAEEGVEAVIAPPFAWGVCQSTGGFFGSFRIRKETAKNLLLDILTTLDGFGFKKVFGVNAHGDIDQNIMTIEAFSEASATLSLEARYLFDRSRLVHYGLSGNEPFLSPVDPSVRSVGSGSAPDIHAGDIETAVINRHYPGLADTDKAETLPPVRIADDRIMEWLFGGKTAELSVDGYLGDPAAWKSVDVDGHLRDLSGRLVRSILISLAPR